MLLVESREYKVMLRPAWIADRKAAVETLLNEVAEWALLHGVPMSGDLKPPKKRVVRFFDTPGHTLRRNGLVLRRRDREDRDSAQYTLKRRSPDRYYAAGVDLTPGEGLEAKPKFEEDIAAGFRSRFSHSAKVTLEGGGQEPPATLAAAAEVFPMLARLEHDGRPCLPETELTAVNGVHAHERVYKGMRFDVAGIEASIAVILWTRGWKGRPIVAELSFRYGDEKESYSAEVAATAKRLFHALQTLDWCTPESPTKTQHVYGELLRRGC